MYKRQVGDFPVDATDGTEFTAVDEVFDLLEAGVGAHVEHGGEDFVLVRVGGDEALAVGLVNGDGLFHKNVEAGLKGGDADGGVAEVRGADEDGVEMCIRDSHH